MSKTVKDLMLPLDDYALVSQDATLLEALLALDAAQSTLGPDREPHRAVLAVDERGTVVGKLGQLGFLKALEPRYDTVGDVDKLARVGLSADFISSMMSHMELWKDSLTDVCRRARFTRLKQVMRPVTESVPEDAPLSEALHKIIMWQSLSLLVTRGREVVGILRLSDLFGEVAEEIKRCAEHAPDAGNGENDE